MELCRDDLQVITKKYDACVLGSSNVGKSSMIYRFIYDQFIGNIEEQDLYTKKCTNNRGDYDVLTIYDSDFTNDMYTKSMQLSVINASCLVFAYAIDDSNSFIAIEDYYHHINSFRKVMPPCFVVGCKSDLETQRHVSFEEGGDLATKLNCRSFRECSAKENIGVAEVFQDVIDVISELRVEDQPSSSNLQMEQIKGAVAHAKDVNLSRNSSMSLNYANSLSAMRTNSSLRVQPHSPSKLRQAHSPKSVKLAKTKSPTEGGDSNVNNNHLEQIPQKPTLLPHIPSTSQTTLAEAAPLPTDPKTEQDQINVVSEKEQSTNNRRSYNKKQATSKDYDNSKNKCCVIT
ncbi:hypothetical protein CANMA_004063 [Candida margitis]|uniref:uncharacterized protein n=1 Tax=Candida margitis TaxID=1775924 RepID=UPI00222664B9|nr:uncharacterized protein CANMA_004063 [Candida margitis]KAI5959963.1 hypothetical protein CANMA_004063 [Candida margitis]